MSNKKTGTAFEREFALLLAGHGFWAHCMADNVNGQPFDVIAARNGVTYVFDCKDCQGKVFRLSRIEENQHNAMTLWSSTGNKPGLFAIRCEGTIYLVPHRMLAILKQNGTKQISQTEMLKYGRVFQNWVDHQNKMYRKVNVCR